MVPAVPRTRLLAVALICLAFAGPVLAGAFKIPGGAPAGVPGDAGDVGDLGGLGDIGDLSGLGGEDASAGGSCDDADDCTTGNCRNGVCCIKGKACCKSNAECDEGQRCDTERFYCVADAAEDQVTSEDVQKEIDAAAGLITTAEGKEADASAAKTKLETARTELSAGNTANAFKLAMEAKTEAEKVVASIKKEVGEACAADAECDTNNCNDVCCMAGNVCCTTTAMCKQGETCDTERFFCVGPEESGERPKGFMNTLIYYREIIETLVYIAAGIGAILLFLARRSGVVKEQEGAAHPSTVSDYGGYYAASYNYGYAQEASPYPQAYPETAAAPTEAAQPSPYAAAPPAAVAPAEAAAPAAPVAALACPYCGGAVEQGAAVCPSCGNQLATQ